MMSRNLEKEIKVSGLHILMPVIIVTVIPIPQQYNIGLPAVLRRLLERTQANWSGICRLEILNTPCPIALSVQREALRITREAVNNAVKHAAASEIVVRLAYSEQDEDMMSITIEDNGQGNRQVQAQPDRWGVRNMFESARAAGGTLEFRQRTDGGTIVSCTFPLEFQETA